MKKIKTGILWIAFLIMCISILHFFLSEVIVDKIHYGMIAIMCLIVIYGEDEIPGNHENSTKNIS